MTGALTGFVVGVTAARRSEEQIALFERHGASCLHGPTVRMHAPRPDGKTGTVIDLVAHSSIPKDPAPAESLVTAVCDRRVDALTFTSRKAVKNFAAIASSMNRWHDVVDACAHHVQTFSIGPLCAQRVVETGLGAPVHPERARLGAMVACVVTSLGQRATLLQLGGVDVMLRGRSVSVDGGSPVVLAGRERQVFDALLARPGAVYSKDGLLRSIWGRGETDTHVVEVTVGRLRKRLGVAGSGIETVIRRGYRASAT